MTKKAQYRELCSVEKTIPIFSRDWWLDATCGDAWDVCLVTRGDQVVASMPYHFRRKYGLTIIAQPPFTQTTGPWLRPTELKYAKRLAKEKELLLSLIDQLPGYAHFCQTWDHSKTNWLPFYWRGFDQTTRYTYRLTDLSDLDSIWTGFRDNIRRSVRKASHRLNLQVRTDLEIDDFLPLYDLTFKRQGLGSRHSKDLIRRIDQACSTRGTRKLFIAYDEQNRPHAGAYLVWDEHTAYYLMGGGDPELRSSGAASLCLWEAIKFASQVSKSFDFEGSMIEPIEHFFRGFGATQTPYFQLTQTPSRLLHAAIAYKQHKGKR